MQSDQDAVHATTTSRQPSRRELLDDWLTTTDDDEWTRSASDDTTRARRNEDGSGVLYHDHAVEAIHLGDGRVLPNPRVEPDPLLTTRITETNPPRLEFPERFAGAIVRAQTTKRVHPIRFATGIEDASAWGAGLLLEHDCGVQVYVGHDETATSGHERFGFVLDDTHGPRAPTAKDAISLLQPPQAAPTATSRHGEWWFSPSPPPAGTPQYPGVRDASPLDNHIPQAWATHVADQVFLDEIHARLPTSGPQPHSAQAVVELATSGDLPIDTPVIRRAAGGIHVRGTLHHRHDDHDAIELEGWHRADTHDWDVLTEDDAGHLMMFVEVGERQPAK